MMKRLFGLLGAWLALIGIVQACGPDMQPLPPPRADGGTWVVCGEQDAGACAPGEHCLYVERYERSVCARPCDATLGCGETEVECCGGGEDGGVGGYCLPRDVCEQGDAGVADAGSDVGPGPDGGTEPNGSPDAGSDAGPEGTDAGTARDGGPQTDAGTGSDAGTSVDAGTRMDAGTPMDAGLPADAGFPVDAGTDAGTGPDAGTDGGLPSDAGTDGGFPGDGGPDAGMPDAGLVRIRIMASNLSSGNNQSYDPGHGTRLMQGVRPDVVLIQEFNYGDNTPTTISNYVTSSFGVPFRYYREAGAQIPNGIISRWPIIASGEWDDPQVSNRDFAWARIDIPGPKDLWAVSVHLLTANATVRNSEASSLVQFINNNVPPGDYLVIGGDFNTDNRGEPCLSTLSQVVSPGAPYPADRNGNSNTNFNRNKPYDDVLVDGDLRSLQRPTLIGSSAFPNGLVLDSRVYTPLSEIAPAQAGDSAATNMQHMGVIKDFLVPTN
ncbi:endonuclease/exonuclease/phosphatase family protein [Hyalangium rubrum]|uniref:Endonuclease n=1 Tax=Hyalangium rubrum TaxID=3103134 RepID=A0ABU5HAI6_9BACT|nr:endonuclease/exonuclease/phosphatase family protein [Hyalangium sp. s54d21]MDY7229874.1 endonuclease [Hyalangium sp. s54d21]